MNSEIERYLTSIVERFTTTEFIIVFVAYLFAVGIGLLKGQRQALYMLAIGYCLLILYVTVFSRPTREFSQYRIIPFYSYIIIANGDKLMFIQILLNVILFVPMGFLMKSTFCKWNWKCIVLSGTLLSFTIEFLQLVFHKGMTEVDDVIHNTIGTFVGYSIYVIITRLLFSRSTPNNN